MIGFIFLFVTLFFVVLMILMPIGLKFSNNSEVENIYLKKKIYIALMLTLVLSVILFEMHNRKIISKNFWVKNPLVTWWENG